MDKKGFLKILEAIIAIIIVFGFVIFLLPKTERNTGKVPIDLELIAKTILDDAQLDPDFRKCVLGGTLSIKYPKCIRNEVNDIAGTGNIWVHAEKICEVVEIPSDIGQYTEQNCKYLCEGKSECNDDGTGFANDNEFIQKALPPNRDVYTKSVIIAYPDVTVNPPDPLSPTKTKQLKLYFWSK